MAYDEQNTPCAKGPSIRRPKPWLFLSLSLCFLSTLFVLPGLFSCPALLCSAWFLRLPTAQFPSTSTGAATPNGQAIDVRADGPKSGLVGAKRGQHHRRSHAWRHGLQFSIPMFNLKRPPIRAKTPFLTLGSAASPLVLRASSQRRDLAVAPPVAQGS